MKAFFDYLIDSLVNALKAMMNDFQELGKDIVFWCFEQLLDLMGFVTGIIKEKLPDIDTQGYWNMAPDNLLQILTYIDFAECMGIVTAAIGIRLVLNLIPFIK